MTKYNLYLETRHILFYTYTIFCWIGLLFSHNCISYFKNLFTFIHDPINKTKKVIMISFQKQSM